MIIGGVQSWRDWVRTPAGRTALEWELARFDAAVADAFGYFALQCGPVPADCLRESRILHRIQARLHGTESPESSGDGAEVRVANFEELPFASQSLDLVALPHVLEHAEDPYAVLREVERVLRPEGRVLVAGFNPISLWGARQLLLRRLRPPFLPPERRLISAPRLRDWLGVLGFGIDQVCYGCHRPPFSSDEWFARSAFIERAGDRWWPICGGAYFVAAVKRVRGVRLIGPMVRRAAGSTAEPVGATPAARVDGVSGTCTRASSAGD